MCYCSFFSKSFQSLPISHYHCREIRCLIMQNFFSFLTIITLSNSTSNVFKEYFDRSLSLKLILISFSLTNRTPPAPRPARYNQRKWARWNIHTHKHTHAHTHAHTRTHTHTYTYTTHERNRKREIENSWSWFNNDCCIEWIPCELEQLFVEFLFCCRSTRPELKNFVALVFREWTFALLAT